MWCAARQQKHKEPPCIHMLCCVRAICVFVAPWEPCVSPPLPPRNPAVIVHKLLQIGFGEYGLYMWMFPGAVFYFATWEEYVRVSLQPTPSPFSSTILL